MTKEEMIDILKGLVFGTFDRTTAKEREALDMAIRALEQDTVTFDFELYEAGLMDMPKEMIKVFDKIRAEIKEESRFCPLTEGLERALEIIDKYTAEKE